MKTALLLFTVCCLTFVNANAAEFTGRLSMLGASAQASSDQLGYQSNGDNLVSADQQGLRLMLDSAENENEWSVHLKNTRQHLSGYPVVPYHYTDLFRYQTLTNNWADQQTSQTSTRIHTEVDRAFIKHRFHSMTLSVGRQAIDWGSGRFWQPENVFGAFAPTDLDTDFKPGIDAVVANAYPSNFSSLTAAYVLSPQNSPTQHEDNGALYYRSQFGNSSEFSLLASRVIGNSTVGGSLETSWKGIGLRLEGTYSDLKSSDSNNLFWIAGADYQFENGTLLIAELYQNGRGAVHESDLAQIQKDPLYFYGLQPQLSRNLAGLAIQKDVTPLWQVNYQLIGSYLEDSANHAAFSWLHQLNATYSISNESNLLISALFTQGKGLDAQKVPQSEFGHIPAGITVRWMMYF
ncbi:MAG: hypothetical protein R3219_02705 [Hydrogenovibrio sp.]|nr:hypothetical protein [Hydrogenovibrio sp.]